MPRTFLQGKVGSDLPNHRDEFEPVAREPAAEN